MPRHITDMSIRSSQETRALQAARVRVFYASAPRPPRSSSSYARRRVGRSSRKQASHAGKHSSRSLQHVQLQQPAWRSTQPVPPAERVRSRPTLGKHSCILHASSRSPDASSVCLRAQCHPACKAGPACTARAPSSMPAALSALSSLLELLSDRCRRTVGLRSTAQSQPASTAKPPTITRTGASHHRQIEM